MTRLYGHVTYTFYFSRVKCQWRSPLTSDTTEIECICYMTIKSQFQLEIQYLPFKILLSPNVKLDWCLRSSQDENLVLISSRNLDNLEEVKDLERISSEHNWKCVKRFGEFKTLKDMLISLIGT